MLIRIYNPNDRTIRRRIFTLERKARFLSPAPEYQLTNAGAGSVNRNQRLSLRRKILVERLNNQELPPLQRLVLYSRDYRAYDSRELHPLPKTLDFRLWTLDSGY